MIAYDGGLVMNTWSQVSSGMAGWERTAGWPWGTRERVASKGNNIVG